MKKILMMTVLLTGATSYAQFDGRCGQPQGSPCRDFYSRFDAFKKLQAAENGIDDATGNLNVVEEAQKRFGYNLEYVTDNFIYIQRLVGGENNTSEARSTFQTLANAVTPFYPLDILTTEFALLMNTENGLSDAIGNFQIVMQTAQNARVHVSLISRAFNFILSLEGGANNTSEARESFQNIMNYATGYSVDEITQSFEAISRAENGHSDALGNFALAAQAAKYCGSLRQAAINFNDVLNQVGGANNTSEARALFSKLYQL